MLQKDIKAITNDIIKLIKDHEDFRSGKDGEIVMALIEAGVQLQCKGKPVDLIFSGNMDNFKKTIKSAYQDKLNYVRDAVNEKLSGVSENYESMKEKLQDELDKAIEKNQKKKAALPDLKFDHAKEGLSVSIGETQNELIWHFRGYYQVKNLFMPGGATRDVPKDISSKTIRPAVIQITTKGDKITHIKLKTWQIKNFQHYHSLHRGTDCWGDWKYSAESWTSPDDIIRIAKQAFRILETVNLTSPGNSTPKGLPTLEEIQHGIKDGSKVSAEDFNEDNIIAYENEENSDEQGWAITS